MGSTRRNPGSRSKVVSQEQRLTQSESVEPSSQPEKSNYREQTEPKYGIEQVPVASPTEEMSTMESQNEHLSSSEVGSAQYSDDVVEEVHEEEVKPVHMQTMHQIYEESVEERTPSLQTLESETKSPFDSQPVDNSVNIKEETQSGFKLTGNRRKLGSSRRLKGRRHGPEITEPEEEVVENTCSDEEKTEKETVPTETGTISQEELKEQTSPDFNLTKKITSAVEEQENTEEMPEEDITLSLNMMDNRTTVTTDFLNSTEEERKDPSNKDHLAQETNTPIEVTPDEPFSVAPNETETFEIGHEENTRAKPAEKDGISPAADASHSRVEMDNKDESDQRNLDVDVDLRNLDRVEVVEELSSIVTKEENAHWSLSTVDKEKEINETSSVHNDGQKLQSNTSDLQTIESNMIPNRDDSLAHLPDQSEFHNDEFVNPATFVQGTDVSVGEVDVDVSAEPTQQDDFRSNEMQTTSAVIGRRNPSINVLLPPNTEDAINTDTVLIEATQSDKQIPEGFKDGLIQVQPFKSVEAPSVVVADQETLESLIQEPNNAPEGAHKTNFEMKDSNPHVSPNRRRKMGSTRRNHGSRSKVENSHQEQTHKQSESVESSSQPEKSNYREQTEPKYGVEQAEDSSPTEEMSTMESQNEHLSSSEVGDAQHSEDVVEEVHEEEVKPIDMQTMHQIDEDSVEERNPCLQTLESETKSPFDSQPVDNSVSITEETQSGENTRAKPAEKDGISPAADASHSRGETDNKDKTDQRNLDVEVDVRNLDRVEVKEVLLSVVTKEENAHWSLSTVDKEKEINETTSVHNDGHKVQSNTSDLQTIESNMIPNRDDSLAHLPDQSEFHNEEFVNSATFVQGTDVRAGEVDVDVSAEPTQQDDFRSNEMQTTSAVIGRRSPSINVLLPPNTEEAINTDSVIFEATQSNKQSSEGIKDSLIQYQPFKSVEAPSVVVADQETLESVIQEPNNAPEGAHKTKFEMKDSNPHVSPNRRRKMGSTRRNPGSRSKVVSQEQRLTQSESVEPSSQPEKSNYREQTEPKYGIEQVPVASPTEEMSTMESQNEHLSSSEVGCAQHSDDVVEEVHEEEVKPVHMQTMHQIYEDSVEERTPSLQTLESETKLPFDSQPVDNSVSIKEETQSGFKLTGNRRKLGSSRRLKGRRHGPEITEPEEEVVENTCSDEEKTEKETVPTETGTISQEELKEQTSPDFNLTKKITSAVEEQENTEEMPEEDTTLSLNMMDNRTTVTTDFLNSTEEERKDPSNKDHLAQETNTPIEVTPDEPFSVAPNETETFEIGHEENTRAKPAEKDGISPAADASHSRVEMDNKDESDQRNLDVDVDLRNLDRVEVVEELSSIVTKEENAHWSLSTVDKEKEINETSSVHNDGQKLQSNTSDLQTIESNMIPNRDDSLAHLPDQSEFHNEEFVNSATFVQRTDVGAGEVDVDVSAEPTQQDDFRSNEMQTTSAVIGRRNPSINVLLPPNTEDAINTDTVLIEATQSDKQIPEGFKDGLIQVQPFKSVEAPSVVVADQETLESLIQEPNNAPEGAHKTNFEMKDSNPHVSPNRRRKMGSTRRNHGSRSKVENSHQEQTHKQSESVESSSQPEKSNYREQTEPKYGVEQAEDSSPTEEMSTMESQNEHLSSSEVGDAQHSEDVVEEVHEEEVKPIDMQTMHQIDEDSVEERNPCLQTLESETKSPFDSQPVDNSVSITEETQSGFKLTGNRRKLGSSRRLKGRRHGPEITEPEEEVVENTCSDEEKTEKETVPTGTISQEVLKEQTSPDFNLTKKITSAVEEQENTEEMPEEDTTLSLNMMDNRTTVTTDFLNSTEEERKDPSNKDHLAQETKTSIEVTPDEPFSVTQNESETFEIGYEENTRAKLAEKDGISPAADASHSRGETDNKDEADQRNLDVEVGLRNLDRVEVVEELSSIVTKEENAHWSLSTVDKEKEINETSSVHNDGQNLQSNTSDLQTIESNMIPYRDDSVALLPDQSEFHNDEFVNPATFVQGTDVSVGEVDVDVSAEPTQQDDFRSNEMQTTSVVIDRRSPSINVLLPPNTEDPINTDSVLIEATQSDKQSPEGFKDSLIQDPPFKSVEAPSVVVADQEMLESVIQEPNNAPEGAHKTNFEMKDSSPHVSSNRRRKMGSTRRNLGSRSKVEKSHQEQTHTQSESVEPSSQPEKSSYREQTESKYGIEQVPVSSPTEKMSTMESQNEHLSSSVVGDAQHSDDVVEEVHEEEVKPVHMQTMHQIDDDSVEERNPCLQTLESDTMPLFDSQPVYNSLSIKEETHSEFKITGNRRKLGSSRRLKGRRHGPEITEPEEEVVENTCSDDGKTEKETVPTGKISQEELKGQTSPDFKLTTEMTSAVEDSVIIEATQSDRQSPEGIQEGLIQDQPLKLVEVPSVVVADQETLESVIQEPNNAPEGAHITNFEMKDSSPHVSSPNRRRKMGSTRRNLGSRSKADNSNQKQEVDKEDVNVGDVSPESDSVITEKQPPINDQQENSDSEQRKEKVFETVELSHTGESQGKAPAQQTLKENPDSLSQQAETEPHLTPEYLTAISPHDKHDDTSESAAGGRRRKMGSSRKSRGPQKDDDSMMSAQKERDAILTDESFHKTSQEHRDESSALDEKLEVEESVKQSSSGISVSNAAKHSRPLSGKAPERGTPVQRHDAEMHLTQESQKTFSLAGDSKGAVIGSKRYNVMLVGDSSVGKTSLMQRAQSGKFSFEIPASIGLDTSLWTVVVDGKPVVLQLWDTAGQERFHSITRQVFHKAQAFLLMYDITCSQSFTAISYWANCIQEAAPEDVTILLLGNKSDSGKRQVNTEEGEILAKEYNFEFMECSAATGDNVIHSLETVARMLSEKDDTSEEAMVLHKEPPRSKRSGCC
ncbi:uncharacterized protein rab44 [Limanda limanda]|uniref:uncharacterized protein rab44 n=1 Tax=Limanda limanda TaxID=27771 RepID=UPI0029C768FA|nr:uncharacterized protein rab44 [Limanda limanda]